MEHTKMLHLGLEFYVLMTSPEAPRLSQNFRLENRRNLGNPELAIQYDLTMLIQKQTSTSRLQMDHYQLVCDSRGKWDATPRLTL